MDSCRYTFATSCRCHCGSHAVQWKSRTLGGSHAPPQADMLQQMCRGCLHSWVCTCGRRTHNGGGCTVWGGLTVEEAALCGEGSQWTRLHVSGEDSQWKRLHWVGRTNSWGCMCVGRTPSKLHVCGEEGVRTLYSLLFCCEAKTVIKNKFSPSDSSCKRSLVENMEVEITEGPHPVRLNNYCRVANLAESHTYSLPSTSSTR